MLTDEADVVHGVLYLPRHGRPTGRPEVDGPTANLCRASTS
jgi:hypothetical protein